MELSILHRKTPPQPNEATLFVKFASFWVEMAVVAAKRGNWDQVERCKIGYEEASKQYENCVTRKIGFFEAYTEALFKSTRIT